ncbi:MAG: oligosaccharide flippase family protein [Minisyncoccia bacterium]
MKNKLHKILRWSEKYTQTDMVYLAKSGFWSNANFILVNIFSFFLSIAFARFLTKAEYGTYQFILSISSILVALTLTGMNTAVTQAVARGLEGSLKKSIPVQLKHNVIPFLVGLTLSIYYLVHGNITLGVGVLFISFLLPIYNTFNTYTAYLLGKRDFKTGFWFGQGVNIPYYSIMILSIYYIKDPLYLVLVNFGINTLLSIFFYYYTLHKYKPNREEDPATMRYGKELSLINVLGMASSQIDSLLVFHYIGAVELAVYTFATTLPERLTGLLKIITVAAFPQFAKQTRKELQPSIISKSLRLALLTFVFSLVYIIFAPLFFKILYPQYMGSVFYSQIYAMLLVIASLSSLPLAALTATKSKKELYIYNIITPITTIIIMILLMKFFGIWGLILSRGISNILNFIILLLLWKIQK